MDLLFVTCLTCGVFQGIAIGHIVFLGIVLDVIYPTVCHLYNIYKQKNICKYC